MKPDFFSYSEACRILRGLRPTIGTARQYAAGSAGTILRHDVDFELNEALKMAQYEKSLGMHSTYFILHTAPYYARRNQLLFTLKAIRDAGHEIGLHNNLIAEWLKTGALPAVVLETELDWLCENGVNIKHVSAHGDPLCHEHLFLNDYVFIHADKPHDKFINFESVAGRPIPKVKAADFGLTDIGQYGTMKGQPVISDLTTSNFLKRIESEPVKCVSIHPIYWRIES